MIPQGVIDTAESLMHEGVPSKTIGSWRIYTVPCTLEKRIQTKAVYSTQPMVMEEFGKLCCVASAVRIDIRARLPRDIQIYAPTVRSWMRPVQPVTVTTQNFIQFGMLSDQLHFTEPAKIRIFGSRYIPVRMKKWDVRVLPEVRWVKPAGRSVLDPCGFSPIHLWAAGLLPAAELQQMELSWRKLSEDQRKLELHTFMDVFPDNLAPLYTGPLSWQEFQWVTQFRTPAEVAAQLGNPKLKA